MNGGYQKVSLKNRNILVGSTVTIDGIYSKIKNSNQKVILIGDLVIDGIAKNSMFVSVNYYGDNIILERYGIKLTIEPNDTVSYDLFKVDPEFLPEGDTITIELSKPFNVGATFEAENDLLLNAWNTGKNVIIKCDINFEGLIINNFTAYTMRGILYVGFEMPMFSFMLGAHMFAFTIVPVWEDEDHILISEGTWTASVFNYLE